MNIITVSKPLHFQEDFLRAKRNLMWFCSLSIIIFMASISPQDVDAVNIPIIAIKINIDYLIVMNFIVCCYHLVGFHIAKKRQRIFNNQAVYSDSVEEVNKLISDAIGKIKSNTEKLNQPFIKLHHSDELEKFANSLGDYKKRFDDNLEKFNNNLEEINNSVAPALNFLSSANQMIHHDNFQNIASIREYLPELDTLSVEQVFRDYDSQMYLLSEHAREGSETIMWSKMVVDNMYEDLNSSSVRFQKLQKEYTKALSSIESINRSFKTLSEDIDMSEKFKLKWFDNNPSYIIFGIALIVTVLHFIIKY